MVMETEQKGNKVIYTFKQQKNGYGTNKLGYTNFSSPDSDGDKIKDVMEQLKDKKIVTVTIEVEKPCLPRGEFLSCGHWIQSTCDNEQIQTFIKVSHDKKYNYFYDDELLYRIIKR